MALNAFEGNTVNQDLDRQAVPTVGPRPNREDTTDVAVAHQEFHAARQQECSRPEFLTKLAAIFERLFEAQLVVHFEADREGPLQTVLVQSFELDQADRDAISKACNEARISQTVVFGSWNEHTMIAVPMDWTPTQCLLLAVPLGADASNLVPIIYDALAQICLRDQTEKTYESAAITDQLAAITELVSKVESRGELLTSSKTLVDELAAYIDCDVVTLGVYQGANATCELIASSQTESVDRNSQMVRDLQSVIYESVSRGQISQWPPEENESKHALRVHRFFVETNEFEAVHSIPLVTENEQQVGVLVLAGTSESLRNEQTVRFLVSAQRPLAAALRLVQMTHRNRLFRMFERICQIGRSGKKLAMQRVTLCVLAVLLIPAPYRVKCACDLQPILRRFVAAPFDGRLEASWVEPGDVVKAGDVLAKLDGREVLLELSGAEEKLHVASQQHSGYLARHETGDAQIAAHEVQRLRMQHRILQNREDNLEITSPIDGVVVEGDHSRSVGMPLQVGKPLFEIAPLEEMIVEILVPEDDIRFVEIGQNVSISLDAFSLARFQGKLQKVHPKAELRNESNVFIAEINIRNEGYTLRPGMRGRAKISTGWQPLGWNLFHKPISAALEFVGW